MILVKNCIIGDQLEGLCAFFNILIDADCPYYEKVSYKVLFSLVDSAPRANPFTLLYTILERKGTDLLLTNAPISRT